MGRNRSVAKTLLERLHPGKTWQQIVLETVASSDSREQAAHALGISVPTLDKWRADAAKAEPCGAR